MLVKNIKYDMLSFATQNLPSVDTINVKVVNVMYYELNILKMNHNSFKSNTKACETIKL